jgi:hypothetical protein
MTETGMGVECCGRLMTTDSPEVAATRRVRADWYVATRLASANVLAP